METVTPRVNSLRGEGFVAYNAFKTRCPQGHVYADENTYRYPGTGHRRCRACAREYQREYQREKRRRLREEEPA